MIYHTGPTIFEATGNTPYINDVGKTIDIYTFQKDQVVRWEYRSLSDFTPVSVASSADKSPDWSMSKLFLFAFNDEFFKNRIERLPDTVMNGVRYKRVLSESRKFISSDPNATEYTFIGYLRCDKKIPFHLNKEFDEKMGCSLVRLEYRIKNVSPWFLIELEFVKDHLSDNELSVFETWGKYANEHPVN